MGHFGAPTPKRHYAFGNTKMILGLDRGVLRKWKPKGGQKVVTAQRYVDGNGVHRYKGTSSLKATEHPGYNLFQYFQTTLFLIWFVYWTRFFDHQTIKPMIIEHLWGIKC